MKRTRKRLSALLTAVAIINTLAAAAAPLTTYAYTANAGNNPYYTEVSRIASNLTANFKDETERKCCYDAIMTGIFGEYYRDWNFMQEENDLICILDETESDLVTEHFLYMLGSIKYINFYNGKRYYCTLEKINLNEDGINARNYDCLKAVYQTAELLKMQTDGMSVTDKAKHIHDYIADAFTYGDTNDPDDSCAFLMMSSKKGTCSAYSVLFTVLGRYCGLDTGIVSYTVKDDNGLHAFNTVVLENGETRCIDVTWDDMNNNNLKYFMETMEDNLVSHPRA